MRRDAGGDQPRLFAADARPRTVIERDGGVVYEPAYLDRAAADAALDALLATTAWQQNAMIIFGRTVPLPRLTAWYGDPGAAYAYSGIRNEPMPWTASLAALRDRLARTHGVAYNSVLLNLYRDGDAGMGWHADDEPELVPDAPIASLSLGATRAFRLRHRDRRTNGLASVSVALEHGSLLVMLAPLQRHWQHHVPKQPAVGGPRVNLTFRLIAV